MKNESNQIPKFGLMTLKTIIGDKKQGIPPIIPVGRTNWYLGVKAGIYPQPYRLGRINVWAVEDIQDFVARLKSGKNSQH